MKNLLKMCQLARLVYKGYVKELNVTSCEKFFNKTVDYFVKNDYELIKVFAYKDIFFALVEKQNDIYILVRGSNSLASWSRNSKLKKTEKGTHTGFQEMADYIYENSKDYLFGKNIIIVGHSQGASAALITANLCYECGYCGVNNIEVFAFEPANISNMQYINKTKNYKVKRYIVKNNLDIVTSIPPKQLAYNNYSETILYFDRKDQLLINPSKLTVFLDKTSTMINPKNWIESVTDHDLSYVQISIAKNMQLIENYVEGGIL